MTFIRSAVRIPTPDPFTVEDEYERALKFAALSLESNSKRRSASPPSRLENGKSADSQPDAPTKPPSGLASRTGGVYIPPARLRAMQAAAAEETDKASETSQRQTWEALKKSLNGMINKVNVSNIKHIVPELFSENLIRGRGLFCRSVMKAQAASLPFTPVYAAMVAVVNSKLPQVGELLAHRLVIQFRRSFRRNDKAVIHEMLASQILLLLLHKPTDDSVEIAVALTREVGQHLEEVDGPVAMAVFDQFRSILHEADIDKRVQYMIEVLFRVRKDRFRDNPSVKPDLDLVEEEDQIVHQISLDDTSINNSDGLNVFKMDPEYEKNEEIYKKLKAEILGDSDEEDGDEDEDKYSTDASMEDAGSDVEGETSARAMEIKDQTNADLVNLRRKIYLTIKSSGGVEECCHKLLRIEIPEDQVSELTSMVVECASQERTYNKFYGLIGQHLCQLPYRLWQDLFEADFGRYYDTIHRYETARIRIIATFFAYLLASGALHWRVLSVIRLSVEETTSSSRIFIKILFEELVAEAGMRNLAKKLAEADDEGAAEQDGQFESGLSGIMKNGGRETKFAAIGLSALATGLRKQLSEIRPASRGSSVG